ncbi:MAG: hypothetical protein KAR39_05320 [Thermoplasmata archaeon]|nr:hypothetical protein [Thermoplasmata archaeon]
MVEEMVTIRNMTIKADDEKELTEKVNKWMLEAPDLHRFLFATHYQCYNPRTDSFIWSSQIWYEAKKE